MDLFGDLHVWQEVGPPDFKESERDSGGGLTGLRTHRIPEIPRWIGESTPMGPPVGSEEAGGVQVVNSLY